MWRARVTTGLSGFSSGAIVWEQMKRYTLAMQQWTQILRKKNLRTNRLNPFAFRFLGDIALITTRWGAYCLLDRDDFELFLEGKEARNPETHALLMDGDFYKEHSQPKRIQAAIQNRLHFLNGGPTLHGMVLTERCNHGCQYCHSSVVGMDRFDTDMSIEIAEKSVDFALSTSSQWLTLEFQGGEPTANWEVLQHIVLYARQKNRLIGKELSFSLVTNFSLMNDEKMKWLIEQRIQVCTSLDGPEKLHNGIRIYRKGNSHSLTVGWIGRFNEAYQAMGLDPTLYKVEALPTITKDSLPQPKEIVDAFIRAGCRAIFLRKLDPFGFAAKTRAKLGYTMDAFLAFYEACLEYIIERNLSGVEVLERNAAIILTKVLSGADPNYLDLRTPGGAAIGQLAYHANGNIYSSDEGRMVAAMGDETFLLGNVESNTYREVMTSPAVKTLVLAGININEPDCNQCTYQPYCGLQPEYNYKSQGSLSGRMRDSPWCKKHKGIFDIVIGRYARATPEEKDLLQRWTTSRSRDHFLEIPEDASARGEKQ